MIFSISKFCLFFSEHSTKEVITSLLKKFHILDNPRKFAMYEQELNKGKIGECQLNPNFVPFLQFSDIFIKLEYMGAARKWQGTIFKENLG